MLCFMVALPPHMIRLIATRASVDPRTVHRLLAGKPVRPGGANRIRVAIRKLRLAPLLTDTATSP